MATRGDLVGEELEHHEFEVVVKMSPEQQKRFRADHGLGPDEDLGPHVAKAVEERIRQKIPAERVVCEFGRKE
ncbi:hypothetical protein [Nocardiopsis lucentensis]|uniref:hypothetical protein n=1 Tax=Nocardiopsis lucentensis TaxID=53441 RepID=UPI0012697416|nr:hypothetical protein [Nocardiopsis lucentensis]